MSDAARSVQVITVGLNQYVCQYYEAGTVAAHVRRTVNIGMGTCSCLEYQRYRFPFKDVFAGSCLCWLLFSCACVPPSFIFGLTARQAAQGESWMTAFKRWDVYVVNPCYKLYPEPTMEVQTLICHNCYTYNIPLPQVLVQMRNPDYVAALALENADLGIRDIVAPPTNAQKGQTWKRETKAKGDVCEMHIVHQLKNNTQVCFSTLKDKGTGYATRLKTNIQAHSEEQQKKSKGCTKGLC